MKCNAERGWELEVKERLPLELDRALQARADELGLSQSELVLRVVEDWIRRNAPHCEDDAEQPQDAAWLRNVGRRTRSDGLASLKRNVEELRRLVRNMNGSL